MELPDVPLFRGLTADEAEAAVTALRMRRRAFVKGEILLEAGQRAPALGVVLAGRVHMEHLDVWGSKTLLGQAGPGDLFAETYACLPDEPLRVSVVAAENGEALFLETGQLLQCGCEPWRWKLTQIFCALQRVKSGAGAAQPVHRPQDDPRADHGVLLGAGAAKRQPAVYASL